MSYSPTMGTGFYPTCDYKPIGLASHERAQAK